ncbi:MAG: tRNA (adenine-N1)-methyltransferase [Candidatus Aenigmatarchaeota archaeon]
MQEGELILLLSKDSSYLVEARKGKLQTKDGIFDLNEILKKKFGDKIKTHLKKEFKIVKPSLTDILEKRAKRGPQIIMPKDAALILAYTGISPGSFVVDIGTGSGFLAIFLANYIKPGKVVSYEKDRKMIKIARGNVKLFGLSDFIKIKNKDATSGISEKKVDLVTVDIQNPENVVKYAYKALKEGGWLVVYSPTIEEVIKVSKEIRKLNFSYIKTVENIVREWQTERTTRPKTMGIMHTGFITFARKVG